MAAWLSPGALELAYRANLESRLASRILWQVAHGRYRNADELYALAKAVDWGKLFTAARTLRVDVAATRSPLASLEFATLRVKDAVCDRFRADTGVRPSIDKERPDVRVHAYLTEREATLYLDTSGEALFKRGWRRDADLGAAARESRCRSARARRLGAGHAAARPDVRLRHDRDRGGTRRRGYRAWTRPHVRLPEARLVRRPDLAATAPARARPRRARPRPRRRSSPSDIDPRAVGQCRRNAAAAGVAAWIDIGEADALSRPAPAPSGLLIANPPYGVRLEDEDALAAFYPKLGDALKQHFAGWTACLLTGDARLPKLIGLKPSKRTPLFNGAIECRLFRFEIVTGRPRREAARGRKRRHRMLRFDFSP